MQRHAQHGSENRIAPNHQLAVAPASHQSLQAAFEKLELSRFLTLEQAMLDPEYAVGIRNLADALVRCGSAEKIADALANGKLDCRLQFTRAFRAELQAVHAPPELAAAHAS